MKFCLYSIKDELSGYAAPVMIKDEDLTKRYFKNVVENNDMIKTSPKDFSIWEIGYFDTDTATIEVSMQHPRLIERAENYGIH